MKEFIESGYMFKFDDEWNLIKYDSHRFYLTLSGQSISGVDFAGILNGNESYLIEIKNYKQYPSRNPEKSFDEFKTEIYEKAKDSIQLIGVIQKYLERKFLYRSFYGLVRKYPFLNREWFFWSELYRITIENRNASFILLVDAHFDIKRTQEQLTELLNSDYKEVRVISLKNKREIEKMKIGINKLFKAN